MVIMRAMSLRALAIFDVSSNGRGNMSDFKPQANWNEYQWEHEIRRDERRISRYFRELPACLDLPGEEDMIFNSLLSHTDLVPTAGTPAALRCWYNSDDDDSDDFEDEPETANRPGND